MDRPTSSGTASIWSVPYVTLIAISLFQSMGQTMMSTLVPLYAYELGATAQVVGIVAGAFAATALLLRPFAGPAFDSLSKKRILLVAIAVIAASTFLYGLSQSIPALTAARLLHGAGMAFASPVAMTLVAASLPAERMSSGISVYSLAFALAQCVGPFCGLWLVDVIGFNWTFRVTTILMLAALVLAATLREPDTGERKPYQLKLSRMFARQAVVPSLLAALLSLSFSCIGSFIVIYGRLRGVADIGVYFTVYALCLLATRPLFGRLSDRFGPLRVLPFGFACFACSMALVGIADSFALFMVAAVVGACGFGAVLPLLQSLSMVCTPRDARGAASNTTFIGLDLGNLFGPILGGTVVGALCAQGMGETAAYSAMYLLLIVPIAAGFAIFLASSRTLARLMRENGGNVSEGRGSS